MHQPGLPASVGVSVRFLFGNQAPESRVDFVHRLAKEEASVLARVIAAMIALPADAEIHDPMMAGIIDKVLDNPRWHDKFIGEIDVLIDKDRSVGWQVDQVVPSK